MSPTRSDRPGHTHTHTPFHSLSVSLLSFFLLTFTFYFVFIENSAEASVCFEAAVTRTRLNTGGFPTRLQLQERVSVLLRHMTSVGPVCAACTINGFGRSLLELWSSGTVQVWLVSLVTSMVLPITNQEITARRAALSQLHVCFSCAASSETRPSSELMFL